MITIAVNPIAIPDIFNNKELLYTRTCTRTDTTTATYGCKVTFNKMHVS